MSFEKDYYSRCPCCKRLGKNMIAMKCNISNYEYYWLCLLCSQTRKACKTHDHYRG